MQRQGMELPPDAPVLPGTEYMGIKALVLQAEKDSLPVTDEEIESDIDNQIRYFKPIRIPKTNWKKLPANRFIN